MSIWTSITGFFSTEEKAIATYFGPLLQNIENNAGTLLCSVATECVNAVESATNLAGSAKLSVVLTAIESVFKTNGIPYLENEARGAVEAAVAALPSSVQAVVGIAANVLPTLTTNTLVAQASSVIQQGIAQTAQLPAAAAPVVPTTPTSTGSTST